MKRIYNFNKGKNMKNLLGGLGIFGAILSICFALFMLGMSVYGLYLAFSASIILGIIAFFVEPSPLIFGLVMFFFDKNLPLEIIEFLTK